MHRSRIFHPCRQNLLVRDASPQDFSSLQTKSPRQGCIAPRFFIPADRISSPWMRRPGSFHPCRQNLLGRDASPQDFSSLQTESSRQGCIVSAIMAQACRAYPQSAELTSIHLNACRAPRSPPSSPQFTSTLAGRTLIKPAVPIFKLPAFIPDDLFPVSRSTFRIQLRITSSVSA